MTDLATTVTALDACGKAGVAALLLSDPGLGKTALVQSLAAAEDVPCAVVIGSIREPADIAGLPVVTDNGVVLSPPAWARMLMDAGEGILYLDELTTSAPATQAAMLTLALDRTVGDVTLPEQVRVIAAANPPDRAADGYDLSAPLANRFCHIGFQPTAEEWITGTTLGWSAPPASRAIVPDDARRQLVKATVTGFIRTRPDLLHAFPETSDATGGAWPSRRTWTMLADSLAHVRDDDTAARHALAFGLVGEGAAIAYLEWVAAADLPDPAAVIADPSIVDWADRPDRVWAILSAVVGWATQRGTIDAWREAWSPLLAAADAGAPDQAAAAARVLGRARPAKAAVPARVRTVFKPILTAAGLDTAGAA